MIEITPTTQRADGPANKPEVPNPVLVRMERPVYYVSERGPLPISSRIFCGRDFAETVLSAMHDVLESAGWSIAHIGIYNPRQARRANGALIKPVRWSNHAHAEAMDFKGLVTENGQLLNIPTLKQRHSLLLGNLLDECEARIKARHRRPEIVDEGGWLHIGLWPVK